MQACQICIFFIYQQICKKKTLLRCTNIKYYSMPHCKTFLECISTYLRINYFCFQLDTHLVTLLQSEPTNVSYLMHIKHSKGTKYDTFGDKGCMLVFDNEGKSTLHIYNPNFGIQLSSYRAGIASHYIYQDSKLLTSLMYWYICFLPGWSGAEIKCSSMLYPNQFKLDQKR